MINEVSCHSRGVFEGRLYTRLNRSVLSLISARPLYSSTADLRSTAKSPPMELLAKYIASFYLKKCSPPYIRACLCHNNYVDKHCFFINKFLFESLTRFRPIIDKTLLSVNNISPILQGLFSSRFFFWPIDGQQHTQKALLSPLNPGPGPTCVAQEIFILMFTRAHRQNKLYFDLYIICLLFEQQNGDNSCFTCQQH